MIPTLTPPSPFWADLESPLADRLAVLWCADGNYEILSRTFGVPSGSSPPVLGLADVGRVYVFPGGAANVSYLDFGSQPIHANIAQAQPFTVFSIGSPTGNGIVAAHSDNNGSQGWEVAFTAGSQFGATLVRSGSNGTAVGAAAVSSGASGASYASIVSHDGQNLTTSGAVYIDARPEATSTAAGSGTQNSDAAQHLYIGGSSNTGVVNACFTGSLKMMAVWRRVLLPAEIEALYLDPMLLYRAPKRRRPRSGAKTTGGGAGTTRPSVFVCT